MNWNSHTLSSALSLAKAPLFPLQPKTKSKNREPISEIHTSQPPGMSRVVNQARKPEARSGTELKGNGTEISSCLARAAETHPL